MKKYVIIASLGFLVLLAILLPLSNVLASKTGSDIILTIRNQAGGDFSMTLIDLDRQRRYSTHDVGSVITRRVPVGRYTYYIDTPCGKQTGVFNMDRNKQLNLYCVKENSQMSLIVR